MRFRCRKALLLLATGSALLTACGSDTDPDSTEEVSTSEIEETNNGDDNADAGVGSNGDASDQTKSSDSSNDSYEIEESEIIVLPAGPAEFPMLGGIELELPVDSPVAFGAECVTIETADYQGDSPFPPYMIIGHVNYTGIDKLDKPVASFDDWLALYTDAGETAPEPTGETVELLGETFTTYKSRGAFPERPPASSFMNCSTEQGVVSDQAFLPARYATIHVTEYQGGLLFVFAEGYTEDESAEVQTRFEQILPTLKLVGQ